MKAVKIRSLARQIRGVSYKPEDIHSSLNEQSIILLRANNIENGAINLNDVLYVDKKKVSHEQILRKGDILICASSGSKNLVGKAALFMIDDICCFGAFCKVVRPINIEDAGYISMFFQSAYYRDHISAMSIGININNIRNEHIDGLSINWPDEQRRNRIVTILTTAWTIMENKNKQLSALDDLIKARFVEMFAEDDNLMAMSEVCLIITDGTHQPPKFRDSGIPFIFVSNITGNKITYDAEKYIDQETYDELIKRTPIEIGDILLSTVGSYGHPAVVKTNKKFLFQRHIAYLKPNKELVDSDYLHGAILSPNAQRQIEDGVKGIAQKTLNLSEIKKMRIPVPDLERQKEYAAFMVQIDKSKDAIRRSLAETQTLFDSLMQQYFG